MSGTARRPVQSVAAGPAPWPQDTLDLSVVVPFYNPGSALRPTVKELVATLRSIGLGFEVICVSDGATDGSEDTLHGESPDVVRVVRQPHAGKGQALRSGFAGATGRYVGFIDADGDLPPSQLSTFVRFADGTADVVAGSKLQPGSNIALPPLRRVYSWAWQLLTFALFRLRVRDTQTGLKLIRREVLDEVLPRTKETGFAFDVELLVVARHLGHTKVVEVPVVILKRHRSTVSARTGLVMALDLFRIFWRLHVSRAYDGPDGAG